MIYVFREKRSNGARELAEALEGKRVRHAPWCRSGDVVVCWGEELDSPPPGVRILNGAPIQSKWKDIEVLTTAGVRTVQGSLTRPQVVLRGEQMYQEAIQQASVYMDALVRRDAYRANQLVEGITVRMQALQLALAEDAAATQHEWLGRRNGHVGGNDLLNPQGPFDFWVRRENIVAEVRIHCFGGKSIRAGVKVERPDVAAHAWIRSFNGGWRILYDGFESKKVMRELASSALSALGLDFGAVDLGQLSTGEWIVLEVNRAPGIEGNSIGAYGQAIQKWVMEH